MKLVENIQEMFKQSQMNEKRKKEFDEKEMEDEEEKIQSAEPRE